MGIAAMALGYCFAKVREAVTALVPQEALATVGNGVHNLAGGMKRALTSDGEQTIYKMGMVAALIFAGQMFNFPIDNGTSGHMIGGVFAAVILGPFAGAIVLATVLAVQMSFFADGGLWAIGANIINMAFVGSFLSYYIYYFAKKVVPVWLAIVLAAWSSVVLAALACSLELGLSGTIPYAVVIPAMFKVHVIIGVAEALLSLALINMFRIMLKEEK
jgi:cobalt/nickel transport system permease protein